jgi:cytochrome c oxidase assembly factor CtaG
VGFSVEPGQLWLVAVAGVLYAGRARTLGRRGQPVSRLRVASFGCGLLVLVIAVVSPIDTIGESRLFSVHMLQHVLIGDVAPLLLVLGLSGRLLRPVLALPGVWSLRWITHPLVAVPIWLGSLAVWHLPWAYDAALGNEAVHALEHCSFLVGGLLLWSTLLGLLPGPRWFGAGTRLSALGVVWLAGAAIANVFIWSTRPYYTPYVDAPRTFGLSPLADQRAGGGVMLVEMMLVGFVVFAAAGLAWLGEAERRQLRLDPQ